MAKVLVGRLTAAIKHVLLLSSSILLSPFPLLLRTAKTVLSPWRRLIRARNTTLNHFSRYNKGLTYGSRDPPLPSSVSKKKNGKGDSRRLRGGRTRRRREEGERRERGETYAVASRPGRPRILHCVFFRDK